jgi:crotonobetainyl-CoA:carnitine CoA-transferase CaiB-like acyl-CoA transferase
VGAIESQFWEDLCNLIDRPDLIPDQYSPEPRRTEVINIIQSVLATKTSDQWFRIMRERRLPCTPVLTLDQVLKDPHARERQMLIEAEQAALSGMPYIGNPCKVSGLDAVNIVQSPKLGQHSVELLEQIGYSQSEIKALLEAGIVAQSA